MKRITIKDIAKLLQISTSTVSRALNDHPDISDLVKTKVKEVAALYHYVPNDFAINFRKKSTKVIGLIIPKMSMFFIPSIIEGISAKINKEGYKIIMLSSEESLEIEKENIQICAHSHVDGVLISLSSETENLNHLAILDSLGIPIVIFDKSLPQNIYDEEIFDNESDAKACAQYLLDQKCSKILALFGNESLEITQKRKEGFLKTIQNFSEVSCKFIHCNSAENTKEKIEVILENEKFDGIFAMSDEILAGLNYALNIKEISPKDFTIISISEGILPKYLNPHYQFIKNDGLKMGVRVAEKLLQKIKK